MKVYGLLAICMAIMLTGCSLAEQQASEDTALASSSSSTKLQEKLPEKQISISNVKESGDSSSFSLTWAAKGYYSIKETYKFEDDVFSSSSTTIKLMNNTSFNDVTRMLDAFEVGDVITKTKTTYKLSNSKTYLLSDCEGKSLKDVRALAEAEVSKSGTGQSGVAGDSLSILEITEDTLSLDKYVLHIGLGEIKQIVIAECPSGFEKKLIFKSDHPEFATVDQLGNVTGVKSGVATITVSLHGASGYSSCMVYVY